MEHVHGGTSERTRWKQMLKDGPMYAAMTRPTTQRMRDLMSRVAPVVVSIMLVAAILVCPAKAQSASQSGVINREYPIKAAFLYHFSTYIQWPSDTFPSASDPFVIGVYGTNPFGAALDKVAASKKVSGRSIVVRVIGSLSNVKQCHILFVPESVPAGQQVAAVQAARDSLVLVVGETDDFVTQGGDIQFFLENNKVRFAFNAEVTRSGELKVSSKLLSLAKIVSAEK